MKNQDSAPFLNEAQVPHTLQENQAKYPTNINGEEYPAFIASAAGWEPLHLCAVGGVWEGVSFKNIHHEKSGFSTHS